MLNIFSCACLTFEHLLYKYMYSGLLSIFKFVLLAFFIFELYELFIYLGY